MTADLNNNPLPTGNAADDQNGYITVAEAARRLGRSRTTVYRLNRHNGPVAILWKGRRVFVHADSLNSFIENRDAGRGPANRAEPVTIISAEPTQATVRTPQTPAVPTRERGQRELTWTGRRPSVVIYVW